MSDYLTRTKKGTSFSGSDVNILRAITIAAALDLYAKTGMKANRAYTPSAMLRATEEITGIKFPRGHYGEAAAALRHWADEAKDAPRA